MHVAIVINMLRINWLPSVIKVYLAFEETKKWFQDEATGVYNFKYDKSYSYSKTIFNRLIMNILKYIIRFLIRNFQLRRLAGN
jgi:hypothetical protein